jgi:ABC-2 type transport system ATP-binding protein
MVTLENVRKSYGAATAVDGLTIEVRGGEIFGLLGPNGAGKSTTVHLAVGLLRPDAGRVTLGGGDPSNPAVRRRLGLAPQALALYDELSGRENLEFFARTYGLRGAALASRVAWALDFVRLVDRAAHRVATYSGGMKRRLNIAAALVHDPAVILLDEPTVGVDPQSRNAIFESIKALKAEGRTVIYTTHYMEEAERLCDRVAVMDHGRLLALDTVGGLIARHAGAARLVVQGPAGEERIETADPLAELNRRAAVAPLAGFRLERPTLEEVFLRLTGRTLRD